MKPCDEIPRHPDSPCRRCWRGPDCGDRIDKCRAWRDWFCRSWRRMQMLFWDAEIEWEDGTE